MTGDDKTPLLRPPLGEPSPASSPEKPVDLRDSLDDLSATPSRRRRDTFKLVEVNPKRYQLGALIGEGGMGKVFAALDTRLGRNVAVKVAHEGSSGRSGFEARIAEEARVLASLDAPGTLPIYDSGKLEGRPFYAMKWVRGTTLAALFRERTMSDLEDPSVREHFLALFVQSVRIMAAVHAEGVVHRDLKPANIMVDDFDIVHVMDWGLARRLGDSSSGRAVSTGAGQVIGTPGFMSPEQLAGKGEMIGTAMDVFALGVILYELLTGGRPFVGPNRDSIVKASLRGELLAPREEVSNTPRALESICLKALAPDPDDRYPSARELNEDLRRYYENRPVLAHQPTLLERIATFFRRRVGIAASLATLILVALLLLTAWTAERLTEKRRTAQIVAALELTSNQLTEARSRLLGLGSEASDREHTREEWLARVEQLEETLEKQTWGMLGVGIASDSPAESRVLLEARDKVRQKLFRDLELFVAEEDWYRALALIDHAFETSARGNVFAFAAKDLELLRERQVAIELELARADSKIDQQVVPEVKPTQ